MPLQGFPENSDGDRAAGGSRGVVVDHQRKAKICGRQRTLVFCAPGLGDENQKPEAGVLEREGPQMINI